MDQSPKTELYIIIFSFQILATLLPASPTLSALSRMAVRCADACPDSNYSQFSELASTSMSVRPRPAAQGPSARMRSARSSASVPPELVEIRLASAPSLPQLHLGPSVRPTPTAQPVRHASPATGSVSAGEDTTGTPRPAPARTSTSVSRPPSASQSVVLMLSARTCPEAMTASVQRDSVETRSVVARSALVVRVHASRHTSLLVKNAAWLDAPLTRIVLPTLNASRLPEESATVPAHLATDPELMVLAKTSTNVVRVS